ncbi:LOW QUALITY PROTEIN: T7L1B-like protein [Mya arenaria]|uniref:T7L1B-like protein n=1 Tax=Mya arenaria TaxID=6604 RepID=A0ABY7DIK5_MYAAR|nr:LOW QUALITY PROTEIN: T7L1B-like protein [Mya arenaria]
MWDSLTKTSAGVAGCKECEAAATGCRSGCSSAPLTVERDRDFLWIRTKMPVCIWPETCLLGCSPLHDHLLGGKVPMLQSPLSVMMGYNNEGPFASPPPAHMGIPTVYPAIHFLITQAPASSHPHYTLTNGYPISSGALGGHYPPSFINSNARYPPGLFPPGVHPGMPHPMGGPKQEGGVSDNHRHGYEGGGSQSPQPEKKKPHIKKPLNAFMLFMKEQRAKVVAECTLKESAAINQILGRRWHALDRSEQAKYYEMARKEKELHLQLYPGWSARDNYAVHAKKKKRKCDVVKGEKWHSLAKEEQAKYYDMARKEKDLHLQLHPGWSARDNYGSHVRKKKPKADDKLKMAISPSGECTRDAKKCRARYGMDQQKNWCKPCRRKKKCIRVFSDDGTDAEEDQYSDSNMGADSYHDSDSMMGSPTPSSASEDPFSTPSKSRSVRSVGVESPLVHDTTRDLHHHIHQHNYPMVDNKIY